MINVNELMLGNWVTKNGIRFYVTEINSKGVVKCTVSNPDGDVCTVDISGCEGIELSPEILEKCGFVKEHEDRLYAWFTVVASDFKFMLRFNFDNAIAINISQIDSSAYITYHTHNNPIKYLHQLQNLIMSLTHTPLKMQL